MTQTTRPYRDSAILAASGFAAAALRGPAPTRRAKTPAVPAAARFALLPDRETARTKPRLFSSGLGLAAAIHALRRDRPIQLEGQTVTGPDGTARRMVAVYVHDDLTQSRSEFLVRAYVDGGDVRALQALLYRVAPNPAERAEAA